jgi:glycosyltransferase involved in cell wall biosynthesis
VRVFGAKVPRGLPGHSIPTLSRGRLQAFGVDPGYAYYWEQVSFAFAAMPWLTAFRPNIIHVSDVVVANALLRLRAIGPRSARIVFTNGGRISPEHLTDYDHVHAVTPEQWTVARNAGLVEERLTMLPLGVWTKEHAPGLDDRRMMRRRLGLSPTAPVAISVASLDASVKRLDYVIREFGRSQAAEWTLLCLGHRTSETVELEQLARAVAPGRVIFKTALPEDVPGYLAAADLFILASRNEGFGLALVEAMAAGLPAIARDVPSLRYIVADDMQLAPLLEPGALAERLVGQTELSRRSTGRRNQERARTNFDWRELAAGYVAMYERTLQRPVKSTARPLIPQWISSRVSARGSSGDR